VKYGHKWLLSFIHKFSTSLLSFVGRREDSKMIKFIGTMPSLKLVGFGRACAPVRCAHPSFWAHFHAKQGAARPPAAHRSFAASY
jgi:hypothetical protein